MPSRILPEQFLAMLADLGLDELKAALAEGEPCTSVRLNVSKNVTEEDIRFKGSRIPWCEAGLYLDQRPRFTFDPALHQGCYYVQEASSMFHGYIVKKLFGNAGSPVRVLDSCAAPGGKTTAVIDSLPAGSLVVANEYVPSRAAVLRENLIKWSYPSCVVTRGDTAAFRRLKDTFDLIVADVPCSGEGMMRKDADAISQWSAGLIHECTERQWDIVNNLWSSLKPGGIMIYSTCTLNRSENEEMVERIINEFGAESIAIDIAPECGIAGGIGTDANCYRFMPHRLRGEGLFVAILRKPGEMRCERQKGKNKTKNAKSTPQLTSAKSWLTDEAAAEMEIYADEDRINAFPSLHADTLRKIKKELDVIYEGILMGNVKGRDLIPSQSLALSPCLRKDAFPTVEIDSQTAISYLSGDAITLPDGTPRGFILLTHRDRPLGFVKNIGNRSNNLYPTPWRIKSKIN